MRQITLLLVGALLLSLSSAEAFDGKRKGFNLGLGLGYTPTSTVSVDHYSITASDDSFVLSLSAGWGFSRELFMYETHAFAIPHGLESDLPCCDDVYVAGVQGRWYHYFGDEGGTFFSCLGAGRTFMDAYSNFLTGEGLGFVVGGDYEFVRQLQVGLYYFGGYAKGNGNTYGTRSLQFVLHITAY